MIDDLEGTDHIFDVLKANNIPESCIYIPFTGALYFQKMKGAQVNTYWLINEFNNRDECFVVVNALFNMAGVIGKNGNQNEWKLQFDVAHLFQIKSTAQAVMAIDELVKKKCYSDAYGIIRTTISRLNMLMLFALNPKLFNEWLSHPKNEKYLDGHVRTELKNNGIYTMPHMYEFSSEIIHSQVAGLADLGYLEMGLFPEHPAIENNIWVTLKFVIGMAYCTVLNMAILDFEGEKLPNNIQEHQVLFNWFLNNYLVHNRIDQLFALMAEDRHVEKVGKDIYDLGGGYDFKTFPIQLAKFYKKGQKKKLSKKYDI